MRKGSKRCMADAGGIFSPRTRCHREAVGAVLGDLDHRTGRYYGRVYGCEEHLHECVRRVLAERLTTSELLVAVARRG